MQTISVEHGAVASVITLNRPERRNAISFEMVQELFQALDEVEARAAAGGARALLLTGAGSAFCSGMDIEMLKLISRQDRAAHLADSQRMSELFRRLYEFPGPSIAAVNGAAVAGGCGLASVCDFTLSIAEAKFGYTEVRIGFIPALVSVYLLRLVGEKAARDLLLTGRLITAEEALRIGLITEIVAPDRLLQRAQELAADLARNSPASLSATKALLRTVQIYSLPQALQAAIQANADIRNTYDFREGVSAFLEKRQPRWRGV